MKAQILFNIVSVPVIVALALKVASDRKLHGLDYPRLDNRRNQVNQVLRADLMKLLLSNGTPERLENGTDSEIAMEVILNAFRKEKIGRVFFNSEAIRDDSKIDVMIPRFALVEYYEGVYLPLSTDQKHADLREVRPTR